MKIKCMLLCSIYVLNVLIYHILCKKPSLTSDSHPSKSTYNHHHTQNHIKHNGKKVDIVA